MTSWLRRVFRKKNNRIWSSEMDVIVDLSKKIVESREEALNLTVAYEKEKRALEARIVELDREVLALKRRTQPVEQEVRIEEPSCEICAQLFAEADTRTPRVLGCGHTVCFDCAEMLVVFGHEFHIQCPFCRSKTMIDERGAGSLPKNFSLLHYVPA